MEGSSIDPDQVGKCGPLSSTLGFTARDKRGPKPTLSFPQKFALLPRDHILTCFCLGPSCHSPSSFLSSVQVIHRLSGGRSRVKTKARGKPPHNQTRVWKGVLLSLSLPKTLSFSRKEPSPAQHGQGEADGWGVGVGRQMAKGILRKHTGLWQLEYYRFSACCVTDQSFLPIFPFPGGRGAHLFFFQGHFFFSKAKENRDNGLEGKDAQSKK